MLGRTGLSVATATLARPTTSMRSVSTFTRSFPTPIRRSALSEPSFFHSTRHLTRASYATGQQGSERGQKQGSQQHKASSAGIRWQVVVPTAAVALLADWYFGITSAAADRLLGIETSSGAVHLDAQPQTPTPTSLPVASISAQGGQVVIDPDTKQALPLYLPKPVSSLPSSTGNLKLVGLGVRTVSFLRVKVYVAALYLDEKRVDALMAQGGLPADASLEEALKKMLDQGTAAVVRIVPVRNTDFNHLRDGFIRALQGRLKKAIKNGQIQSGSDTERRFEESIQEIKDSFLRGSVPKGSALDLVAIPASKGANLSFEYKSQTFGQIASASASQDQDASFSAARELILAYFADQGEISTPFKKSVKEGLTASPA
ncbi:hypothetical protein BCV70DRAFT_200977 [Testicularia cyperi]|uniref:Chalcone isomerase domain-containing protein n=1 Tax=Testicularia cyperi TaxID=1882483 RepID=A0A317XPZ3_9BASI|nr:hypothetical protein BCV70DRAFT_200977 [Testicularia cyperi]